MEIDTDILVSEVSDEPFDIRHYGIKGMRWGVRRSRAQIDSDSEDATTKKSTQAKVKVNRTTDVLSNKELQALNTRMQLEQTYAQLTAKEREANVTAIQRGVRWVGKTAMDVGQQQARNATNGAVNKLIEDKFGEYTMTPTQQQKRAKAQNFLGGGKDEDDD